MTRLECAVLLAAVPFLPASVLKSADPAAANELSIEVGQTIAVFRRISPRAEKIDYPDFYLLETEITNRLYREYVRATKASKDDWAIVEADRKRQRELAAEAELRRKIRKAAENTGIAYVDGRPVLTIPPPIIRRYDATVVEVDICVLNVFAANAYSVTDPKALWRRDDYPAGRDDYPVDMVTVPEAEAFCEWLSQTHPQLGLFRLPTWNEWMIAAYGPARRYPWGDDWIATHAHLGFELVGDKAIGAEPVKGRPCDRTPDGLYGMLGNVAEYLASGDILNREYFNLGSRWMGADYDYARFPRIVKGSPSLPPRKDYWGYRHESEWRDQGIGFRVLLDPAADRTLLKRPRLFDQVDQSWRTLPPAQSDRERKP